MARRQGPLVCCSLCGRDTRRPGGVCQKCVGSISHEEERGRPGRRWGAGADSPFDEQWEETKYSPNAVEEYHGGTIRDDL